ncbi:MAG: hypothetical protein A2381_18045 [Bdellovibrionales bacterium RIFOXYB1_FULL_37_110]|nr:MAG: hypothetical protein A2417_06510 [Bdellovibrionales bacterium RIFOXYC1_FULL_37_79]OFZ58575.1 MAG: hypothetical protein A2381_18045 [Bdellovibrionales bacterium RIFOXYB1_FULL_37_110]OFZ61763.1 MAG: hypothetical protein A2577_19645 [Bdellovibrionales bacterium RIFOXYD1_FULL_36_51]
MKLEYKNYQQDPDLGTEIGIFQYLELFNIDVPILPYKVLNHLGKSHAQKFYQELTLLNKSTQNLEKIMNLSKELPNLDWVLPMIEHKTINQAGLLALYHFLKKNLQLLENESFSKKDIPSLQKLIDYIDIYLDARKGCLNSDAKINQLKKQIDELESSIDALSKRYEEDILKDTSLKMIYPWPKEISPDHSALEKIKKSPLLKTVKNNDYQLIEYIPPKYLTAEIAKKEKLEKIISAYYQQIISKLNMAISKKQKIITLKYEERVKLTYQYILLFCMKKHKLVLPTISQTLCFEVTDGILPAIQNKRQKQYVPLNIHLNKGSNVLFGANMAGKTSVLKTIYFLSFLVSLGLPVPAKKLVTSIPSEVKIHLKSSGTIASNLSSFGEELDFFSKDFPSGGVVLVDELFQTTNPLAGKDLSTIFLKYYNHKNILFFCTTQYPEIIKIKNLNLYKMKDVKQNIFNSIKTLNDLLNNMPFQVEKVSSDKTYLTKEGTMALLIARHFIKNENIKQSISKKIKG